ncbi:hypothetical protein [Microbacterium sp. 77mftsu3.1]|uniref:hypothetical protein n=1 Tax=Microbacterium sp. 77mftsu3.1 TaxID=1761802 RepID=UPI0003720FBB|nr:hypothetical protein [Microbacterium sp. 77mftsu3.1]SDH32951.1 hypothetical protein SAMN04488590_3042 [Microbacterium sp. 77mftsu3.1]
MSDMLEQHRKTRTRNRRLTAAGVTAVIVIAGALAAPPVFDALRYQSLLNEHGERYGAIDGASGAVTEEQKAYEKLAGEAFDGDAAIGEFIAAIDPKLLIDTDALDKLKKLRTTIREDAGIHQRDPRVNRLSLFDTAPAPRTPARTNPTTVGGLDAAIAKSKSVAEDYEAGADLITERSEKLDQSMRTAASLKESVLADAAEYGLSDAINGYGEADQLVKMQYADAIEDLGDKSADAITRFRGFQKALAALAKSHDDVVAAEKAEEERKKAEEAAKKAEDERRAQELVELEEARKAAADAVEQARAEAEAAREAKEEAERAKAEAEAALRDNAEQEQSPGMTPSPTPTNPSPQG